MALESQCSKTMDQDDEHLGSENYALLVDISVDQEVITHHFEDLLYACEKGLAPDSFGNNDTKYWSRVVFNIATHCSIVDFCRLVKRKELLLCCFSLLPWNGVHDVALISSSLKILSQLILVAVKHGLEHCLVGLFPWKVLLTAV